MDAQKQRFMKIALEIGLTPDVAEHLFKSKPSFIDLSQRNDDYIRDACQRKYDYLHGIKDDEEDNLENMDKDSEQEITKFFETAKEVGLTEPQAKILLSQKPPDILLKTVKTREICIQVKKDIDAGVLDAATLMPNE
jgi:hypothetical protein